MSPLLGVGVVPDPLCKFTAAGPAHAPAMRQRAKASGIPDKPLSGIHVRGFFHAVVQSGLWVYLGQSSHDGCDDSLGVSLLAIDALGDSED